MKKNLSKYVLEYNIVIILILLVIAASFFVPNFIRPGNISNLLINVGTYGIMALGLTLVFIVGAIDLSVGFQAAAIAVVTVLVANSFGFAAAIVAGIAGGLILGYINGFVVTRLNITPLIATLATMTGLKGLTLLLTNNFSIALTDLDTKLLYTTIIAGIQLPIIIFAAIFIVLTLFLRYTRTGLNFYIIGGNEEAGKLAGINTNKLIRLAYILSGLCCGIVGILLASRFASATYNLAENMDVTAISSCVIGGVKLMGGKGNMLQALLGVMVIQVISNILTLLSVYGSIQILVTGLVVVAVLIGDKYTQFNKTQTI